MTDNVLRFIGRHNLLKSNELYIVALSGGADSVALLLLLTEQGFRVHAAHCNFHLRGAESDRDELFCMELCERLKVPFHRVHFDTKAYARLHGVSIEVAARELRYRWLGQLCIDIKAEGVCVAHHRDDSVETLLLNLFRGTGLRGLTGIQPCSVLKTGTEKGTELTVLRPLLCVSRAEIEQYLVEKGQKYVIDSTNLVADVMRNKVRLEVLPLLKSINPAVVENIQRTSEQAYEAQKVLDGLLNRLSSSNVLDLKALLEYGSSEYIAFEWLKKYGFNGTQVRQVLTAETGSIFTSQQGYEMLKDRDRLIVERPLEPMKPLKIPEEGSYVLPSGTFGLPLKALDESQDSRSWLRNSREAVSNVRFVARKTAVSISKDPWMATLDSEKVIFPLTLRRVEEGDFMMPYGMKGRKLLSDMMTDLKMNVFEKRRQLVAVDAQEVVVWAVGLRTSQCVAVTKQTREVLQLQVVE